MKTRILTSLEGKRFEVAVRPARVLPGADYDAFVVGITEVSTAQMSLHNAAVRKISEETGSIVDEIDLPIEAYDHIQRLVDRYDDGSTAIVWPDPSARWVIL